MPLDTTGDLETAVRLFSDAFLAGDASTAHRLLSARCRDLVTTEQLASAYAEVGGFAAVQTVDAVVSGREASVTATYADSGLDRVAERWIREDAQWRRDEC